MRQLICLMVLLLLRAGPAAAADEAPKTVLVLNSEAAGVPAIQIMDAEIRTHLPAAVGPVHFYTEHLEQAWFPEPAIQRAILDVIGQKHARHRIDLVITTGSFALEMALTHRAAMFSGAPIVFVARTPASPPPTLPPDVTGTSMWVDWRANLDLILRLQPETRRVAVVLGTSGFERAAVGLMREAFAAYRDRLDLLEVTDRPFTDVLSEVAALRDGTVVIFYSFLRDADGVNYFPPEALAAISRASRVPIYGVSDSHIDHGILGGRLVSFHEHGRQATALAARVLRGQQPAVPDPQTADLNVTMFNAAALKRWRISERRLPPGSIVVGRSPSIADYGGYIAAGLALTIAQTALIVTLLGQRRRRAVAQKTLAQTLRFEQVVAEISTALAAAGAADVRTEAQKALGRIGDELECDRASLLEFTDDPRVVQVTQSVAMPGVPPLPATLDTEQYPWMFATLRRGETLRFTAPAWLPAEADRDRAALHELGTRSLLAIPLEVNRVVVGGLSLSTVRRERSWPDALIGRLQLLAGAFANALARQRADHAMRESEARFRLIADAAPVMMSMARPDGRATYFNRAWLHFTGRTMEQEVGDGWTAGLHPDDWQPCLERYRKARKAREPFGVEFRLRSRDGAYRWLLAQGAPRFAQDGAFVGYVDAYTDITDIKDAHATVLESLALRNEIFGSLYGHVAALDRDGGVMAVNTAWTECAAGGWDTPHPPVGANYLDVCERTGTTVAEGMARAVRAVLEQELPRTSLEYATHTGSEERWFEMTVEPFRRPEGGAIVSHVDITRRRHAELEARRQRDELAHALRVSTLGELAGSLAHEISQPLAAIATNAQAARLALAGDAQDGTELLETLSDIGDDARRAAQVIRRLRALFRKDWAERTPVDVNAMILEVIGLLHHELHTRKVGVQLSLAKDLSPVPGDTIQLQQVVLNVLMNAADAMADTTTRARVIGVETTARNPGTVEISIQDRGHGVAEADLDRIFEPFVTTKSTGLGMGLSISRSIVHAHGGRMWATRNEDGGLTMYVELPCEEDEPPR